MNDRDFIKEFQADINELSTLTNQSWSLTGWNCQNEGFETWYDAAVNERIRRIKAERDAIRYAAVRAYRDARESSFDDECDAQVDSFLNHLEAVDPYAYNKLKP